MATDPDGDTLTYTIAGQGTKGTAAITNAASGTYRYTPNAGASGSDSFTFQVRDPGNLTSTATIAVTIAPGNQPPVAGNGALSTVQDTPATGKLNATDADGDPLTYQVVSAAKLGSVALNAATGSFTYTPNANSTGADTFTFKANDGKADSNVASFTVTINAHVSVLLEAEQGVLHRPHGPGKRHQGQWWQVHLGSQWQGESHRPVGGRRAGGLQLQRADGGQLSGVGAGDGQLHGR